MYILTPAKFQWQRSSRTYKAFIPLHYLAPALAGHTPEHAEQRLAEALRKTKAMINVDHNLISLSVQNKRSAQKVSEHWNRWLENELIVLQSLGLER